MRAAAEPVDVTRAAVNAAHGAACDVYWRKLELVSRAWDGTPFNPADARNEDAIARLALAVRELAEARAAVTVTRRLVDELS